MHQPRGRPGRRLATALAAASLLGLAGCGGAGGGSAPPEPRDAAAARVDGQTIWASDVRNEAAAQGLIGEGEPLDASSELFRRVLDEVVDQKLLAAEAEHRDVGSDPEVRRRLAAARERILGDMLVRRLVEQAVSDRAIRELYAERARLAKPADEFHARQIVVASQAEAEAIRKQLANGAAFGALASERSIDAATRFNGGDLGYFAIDAMPEAYGAALKTAKAGDRVGPFRTDAGWALLQVDDRRPGQPLTLEQARPQIVRFATYDQVRDLLQTLRGKAKIVLLTPTAATTAKPPLPKSP